MPVANDVQKKPTGRAEVSAALKSAAFILLRDKGSRFSVREVAAVAGVNQGLIYRHFGSKENLISETLADTTAEISEQLRSGDSPVDLMVTRGLDAATVLARLVLDDAISLMTRHSALEVLVTAARASDNLDGPPAETRASIASAMLLGWALFGRYFTEASGAEHGDETLRTLHDLTTQLLTGPWPVTDSNASTG